MESSQFPNFWSGKQQECHVESLKFLCKYQHLHLTLKDQSLLVLMQLRLNLIVFRAWKDAMYVKSDFLTVCFVIIKKPRIICVSYMPMLEVPLMNLG